MKILALREENDRREKADYLGPYLLKHSMDFGELFSQAKNQGLISFEASKRAFQDCLNDFRETQENASSEVERMLAEANEEVAKFKEFIVKFRDQFTAENLENISREGEALQLFKNVLQRRLAELKVQNEERMREFQEEILRDERLNPEFKKSQGGMVL